ncbi:MAG: hypothetical protein OHM56_03420 [Spiroplasma phoeniceum]|nr:MAG: hypothetical protein OHM57_02875 [Spiroplasma phoeniceum]UZQ33014.1 MAG: hypothetical protein OHM56_03420 [Spiroplasma phoeniceum]
MINDHFDLSILTEKTICSKILFFYQDDFLFTGSVYDNIVNFKKQCDYQILKLPEIKQLLLQNHLSFE